MLSQKRRRDIAGLVHRKERLQQGVYLVEGIRLVESALQAGAAVREILVTHEAAAQPRVAALLGQAVVPVAVVEARWMRSVSDVEATQGLVALAVLPDVAQDLPSGVRRVLALDGIQDPGNVGTLIRSAAWFGVDAVVAGAGTADLFAPKVVRAAMGGLWDVALVQTDDLVDLLRRAQSGGSVVYGAALDGEAVRSWKPVTPSILVLGSEAHGISEEVSSRVDHRVHIPRGAGARNQPSGVESLNVSAAGAILLHHWTV